MVKVCLGVLFVACGAPSKPAQPAPLKNDVAVPSDDGVLTSATSIEVKDEWNGLGCTYQFSATLARQGDAFVGTASISGGRRAGAAIDQHVSLARSAVAALQTTLATAHSVPAPDSSRSKRMSGWTDDYPSGSTTITGPHGIVKIYYLEQHRQLLVDQDHATMELSPPVDDPGNEMPAGFTQYTAFLDAVGLSALNKQLCGR